MVDKILKDWKVFIETLLIPTITKCGEVLEGSIYSHHLDESISYAENFLKKQENIINTTKYLKKDAKILENGFNSGFSALLMLLSRPDIVLTCVDIGYHSYVRPCYDIIKSHFGDIELI